MIDESAIKRLLGDRWSSVLHVCGEWISDGSWACKSMARPPDMTINDESPVLAGLVEKLHGTIDLTSGPLLVMRTKATILDERPDCGDCRGTGCCFCACGNEHDCGNCNGTGKLGEDVSVSGWAVLGCDGHEEVVIRDLALPLLDGLELRRAVLCDDAITWTAGRWAIVGLRDGQIESVVMPRATEPGECK